MPEETLEYRAENVDGVVDQLFSGRLSIADALVQLRKRLLDLSSRNRLLAYRHPRARCVQFVDNPDLNLLYERLFDNGANVRLKPVPEPEPLSYQGVRKPEARAYAEILHLKTAYELAAPNVNNNSHRRTPALQTLFYPADLDKLLRRVSTEARTVIEETGTNMLYLMFGFLGFYDSDDSDRELLAPLLAVPVALTRGPIDPDTRAYQYTLAYTGEDVAENHTLREKLKQDFRLNLPEMQEEDAPEDYFQKIAQAVRTKNRWKVRHQLTLGFLSFGKLAIWADIDPRRWTSLLEHPLLKQVFEGGGAAQEGALHAEDYAIDAHEQANLPIIYDADSSQHSAIIDGLSGKNMVINGPPGTGKSQTITNLIALALSKGKKVLFVSEKLAALEVVKHRLEKANLGDFCLELHSHKTQKKRLLADIQTRIDTRFNRPSITIGERVETLVDKKRQLNRYAELLGSRLGNELGFTIFEVLWAAECKRQALNDHARHCVAINLRSAPGWTFESMDRNQSKVGALANLHKAIGAYGPDHPWWGFQPHILNPGDDLDISKTVEAALTEATKLADDSAEFGKLLGSQEKASVELLAGMATLLEQVPPLPAKLNATLLPRLFTAEDNMGGHSREVLAQLTRALGNVRSLVTQARESLIDALSTDMAEVERLQGKADSMLSADALNMPLAELAGSASYLTNCIHQLEQTLRLVSAPYSRPRRNALETLRHRLGPLQHLQVRTTPLRDLDASQGTVLACHAKLLESLHRVIAFSKRFQLQFDGSAASVQRLADIHVFDGVLPHIRVDATLVNAAVDHAKGDFSHLSLITGREGLAALEQLLPTLRAALNEIVVTSRKAGLKLDDANLEDVTQFGVLVQIARQAPIPLLEHRHGKVSHHQLLEIAVKAEQARNAERLARASLEQVFYLDDIPEAEAIKAAIREFRGGDGFFKFLSKDWRIAKRLHKGLSKDKRRKRAQECEQELLALVTWVEQRQKFESNPDFRVALGTLFNGLGTDFNKVRSLCGWYSASHTQLSAHIGMVERVDLRALDIQLVDHLAGRAQSLLRAVTTLQTIQQTLAGILGAQSDAATNCAMRSLPATFSATEDVIGRIRTDLEFFGACVSPDVPFRRAAQLLQATFELQNIRPDIHELVNGRRSLAEAGGTPLAGLGNHAETLWPTYLDIVRDTCNAVQNLVGFLKDYIEPSGTPDLGERLLDSRLKLDAAWQALAPATSANDVSAWKDYLARATLTANTASALSNFLTPLVKTGCVTSTAIAALHARRDAIEILTRLENDTAIRQIAGDVFEGERTDLDVLAQTHEWGSQITRLGMRRHAPLRAILLDTRAPENLETASALLRRVVAEADTVRKLLEQLTSYGAFDWDQWQAAARPDSGEDYPSDMKARLEFAYENIGTVFTWSKYLDAKHSCETLDLHPLITVLENGEVPPEKLALAFEFVTYQSMGKAIFRLYPELSRFSGTGHEQLREEFARLDNEIIQANGREFGYQIDKAKRIPTGAAGARAGDYTEMNLLHRELNKQRRHIPIRQLLKRAGRTIQELKPCFMMGPLSVAQYLEPEVLKFDLVVMDEASQLRPEEALGAVARGTQLIVVGDPKQLPPTSFFDRLMDGGEDEESDDTPTVIAGMDSILDICQQLFHPVRTLRWHYRSRHESLIAFSNHHFYKNLIVFPSPYTKGARLGVRYRYIRQGIYKDRQNIPEAHRVVDAVLDHMLRRSEESLGVVTLNQTQRELIEDLLDKRLRNFDEGQKFLTDQEQHGWPFFVKNLENVQGDERDVIFISTTFGKAAGTDKVRQNFGPISRPDGWRRLNVLFTRARLRVELFTSMLAEDIVLEDKTPLGTKALREYLDFARSGVLTTTDETDREPDSNFEVAVANMIRSHDFEVKPQHGVAGFYLDMVVRNPDRRGDFIAAIECDGATYHSSVSARDRDRIRQTILESLGWRNKIYRIWSTDWFFDPRRETAKLLAFLDKRRAASRTEMESLPAEEEFEVTEPEPDFVSAAENEQGALPLEPREFTVGGSDDAFVEIGDRVTYSTVDSTQGKHTVQIVDSASNPRMGIINENTPVAVALLGHSVGEECILETPGGAQSKLRVLKIERGDN